MSDDNTTIYLPPNAYDLIFSYTAVNEYKMTFIPPTDKEIRQSKMANIKDELIECLLYMGMCFGQSIFFISLFMPAESLTHGQ